VLPGQAQELSVAYGPGGRGGGRGGGGSAFSIYVDDTRLATEELPGGVPQGAPGQATNAKVYPLSAELLKGKNKITIKFQAAEGSRVGGVSEVRVLKSAPIN
jgi:hypothetical protein